MFFVWDPPLPRSMRTGTQESAVTYALELWAATKQQAPFDGTTRVRLGAPRQKAWASGGAARQPISSFAKVLEHSMVPRAMKIGIRSTNTWYMYKFCCGEIMYDLEASHEY